MLNMRESLMKWPWSLIFGTDFVIAPDKSEKRDTKKQPFPCKHGGLFFVVYLALYSKRTRGLLDD